MKKLLLIAFLGLSGIVQADYILIQVNEVDGKKIHKQLVRLSGLSRFEDTRDEQAKGFCHDLAQLRKDTGGGTWFCEEIGNEKETKPRGKASIPGEIEP